MSFKKSLVDEIADQQREPRAAIEMDIDQDFGDVILEEGGNMSTNLRKISWNGRPYKLDIRKYYYKDGREFPSSKGFTLTEDGGNSLAENLVSKGYGSTRRLLRDIKQRDDFNESMLDPNSDLLDDNDTDDSTYYDPAKLLEGVASSGADNTIKSDQEKTED